MEHVTRSAVRERKTESDANGPAPQQVGRFYLPELDLVRLVAFLLVFSSHVVPGDAEFYRAAHIPTALGTVIVAAAAGGAFGVDLFFALSSFLITTLLLREGRSTGTIDVWSFYARRVLRIWPLYFAFLLIVTPLVRHWLPDDALGLRYTLAFALFVGNWACVLWGYPHSIAGPLWSVSIEEQFYLAWPLLLRRASRHLYPALAVLLAVSVVARIVLVTAGAVHPEIWCNTIARLDPIVGGALLAAVTSRRSQAPAGWLRCILLCSGFGLFSLAGHFGDFAGLRSLITYPTVALAACSFILGSLYLPAEYARNPVLRAMTFLGKISYGLYVFHFLFISLLEVSSAHALGPRFALACTALACTTIAAAMSYYLLERPFLALKAKFTHIQSHPI
jgi:peptidoglycan/LPS O-acetylase OafA/YrhL